MHSVNISVILFDDPLSPSSL